jgi:hypothetical protein
MRVPCVVEVVPIVSFVCQPNTWLCGPFALKHALLMLGVRADERHLATLAGTDTSGTDEAELARAARHFGCDLGFLRRRDAEVARRDLVRLLAARVPVLLCIEQWDHWVVAVHEEDGTFVVLDSRAPAVFRVLPWEYLRELLVYGDSRRTGVYDLHPLETDDVRAVRPSFTVERARFLQQWENRPIAEDWHGYLTDALTVMDGPECEGTAALLPGVLFGRHELPLLDAVSPTNDSGRRRAARRVLRGLRFVADTYGLRLDPASEQAARERLEAVLRRRLGNQESGVRSRESDVRNEMPDAR